MPTQTPYPRTARRRARLTLDRLIRYTLTLGALGAILWCIWFFGNLFFLLMLSMILAYMLGPIVDGLQRRGMSRMLAVMISFVLVLGGVGFIIASLIPFVQQQVTDLGVLVAPDNLNRIALSVEAGLRSIFPIQDGTVVRELQQAFQALFQQESITQALTITLDLFTNIAFALVIIPLMMFFFMKDGRRFRNSMLRLVPNRYLEISINVFDSIETNIGFYFKALFVRTLVITLVATVLLKLVGLDNAVILGIFTGLANTIPYFGPAIGFVASAIIGIAQTGDLTLVPWVLLAMALTQGVDMVLQPIVFSKVAQTHPLIILCVVLIGAELAGIVGMLISIPVLTIARVTVAEILWSLRNFYIFQAA